MNADLLNRLRAITPEEQEILDGRSAIDVNRYMNDSSMVVDSKKLLESGKLIQIRRHTRFIHFPRHTHNFVEVVYMCAGQTHHVINGKDVILKEGDLLFLNQNATQEIWTAGENDIAVNFIILPEFFDCALQMIGEEKNLIHDFIIGCLTSKDDRIGYLHFQVADILTIQNLMENLIWTLEYNQQNKRSINQFTMGLLFLQLINHTEKATIGSSPEQDLVLTVLRFIEERYKDGELSELAEQLHYDLYWLSRMIRKWTGKTYTDLLQTKRLNQAAFLLGSTRLSVADIGMAVGYENSSYFHRIFRKEYGCSPRQYRVNSENKGS